MQMLFMKLDVIIDKKLFLQIKILLGKAGNGLLDFIYPPICVHCSTPIIKADSLCAKCWQELIPISEPLCPVLGLPFAVSLGANVLSAQAIANPPEFDRARSAFIYNDITHSVISKLKYGDRPEMAKFCAAIMAGAFAEILTGDPILVPVPLHPKRQRQRRYNQSTQLAKELGLLKGIKVAPMLVARVRETKQQVGLSAKMREKNVAGAFKVISDLIEVNVEQRIVIVDDVMTTGATLNAVTKSLKKAGYKKIDVISFARVVNQGEYII
jgi:ComF family protein